jgi:hypothetical protein
MPGTNVIAVKHAVNDTSGSARVVMIGSHLDSVMGGPGADDNGSGTGVYMEIARVLSQYAFDKEVRIGGYGNEENGEVGSKAYVAGLATSERARFIGSWVMDMVGTPYGLARPWIHSRDGTSNYVIQSAYDAAARIGFAGLQNCRVSGSDHEPFLVANIPSAVFAWMGYQPDPRGCGYNNYGMGLEPQYHKPDDTMDNISQARLQDTLNLIGSAFLHSALNTATLAAAAGTPVSGAAVEADCGDGRRYFGETDSNGTLAAAIPHATCDFKATKGLAISTLDDVAIAGDVPVTFSAFHLPQPVLLHGSVDPTHGTIGVDWASCGVLDTNSVGPKTVTCTDDAGHASAVGYNVIYNFGGFEPPVDSLPALNTANSGQAIPLKWRITDAAGNPVTDLASVVVVAASLSCPLGTTPDQVEEYAPGASGLKNQGNGNYQFNWKTPKSYASSCKMLKLDLGEGPGMERTADFEFAR